MHVTFTAAVALLLSMGNLFYRDVKYLFEIVLSVWMFATSVVYPVDRIGGALGQVLALNPDDADHRRLPRRCSCGARCRRPGRFSPPPSLSSLLLLTAWCVVPPRRVRVRGEHLIMSQAPGRLRRRLEEVPPRRAARQPARPRAGAGPARARPREPAPELSDRSSGRCATSSFEVHARRGARHHRPERRRQVDDAEAADPDPEADPRPLRGARAVSARSSRSPPASTRI